ncbi:hypothetical protein V6N13_036806 [Hibiscus sabdariffa]
MIVCFALTICFCLSLFSPKTSLAKVELLLLTSYVRSNFKKFFISISATSLLAKLANHDVLDSDESKLRGDLTTSQCYSCVSKTPELSDKLCGQAVAARVQLSGCYLRYEVAGFKQVPETEFLYKVCGSSSQASVRTEFESRRDTAFNMAEDGVKSGSSLFYTGDYQSVYVLGQCEGDLGTADCGDCVKTAFETAKQDCGDSVSAQVYLDKCYISYSYYPNGIPTISSGSGGTRERTQKTVAISVGGVAGLGFIVVCLMCLKSVLERRSKKHEGARYAQLKQIRTSRRRTTKTSKCLRCNDKAHCSPKKRTQIQGIGLGEEQPNLSLPSTSWAWSWAPNRAYDACRVESPLVRFKE